jgi:hypothetical protein
VGDFSYTALMRTVTVTQDGEITLEDAELRHLWAGLDREDRD